MFTILSEICFNHISHEMTFLVLHLWAKWWSQSFGYRDAIDLAAIPCSSHWKGGKLSMLRLLLLIHCRRHILKNVACGQCVVRKASNGRGMEYTRVIEHNIRVRASIQTFGNEHVWNGKNTCSFYFHFFHLLSLQFSLP